MLQFWQSLCLMAFVFIALLLWEKSHPVGAATTSIAASPETIEEMIMKEVL